MSHAHDFSAIEQSDRTNIMMVYLERVELIRYKLEEFDRGLADDVKSLALHYVEDKTNDSEHDSG